MIGAPDGGALMCNVTCRATSSSCSGVASRVDSPLTLAQESAYYGGASWPARGLRRAARSTRVRTRFTRFASLRTRTLTRWCTSRRPVLGAGASGRARARLAERYYHSAVYVTELTKVHSRASPRAPPSRTLVYPGCYACLPAPSSAPSSDPSASSPPPATAPRLTSTAASTTAAPASPWVPSDSPSSRYEKPAAYTGSRA